MREKLLMYIEELKKHSTVIEDIFYKMDMMYGVPITEKVIEDIIKNDVILIDALAYRFSKFQDTLGKALKTFFLSKGESVEEMTIIDVVNYANKIGFSIDSEMWWKMRRLRNRLSHEYEKEYIKIVVILNEIYEFYPFMKKILNELEERG